MGRSEGTQLAVRQQAGKEGNVTTPGGEGAARMRNALAPDHQDHALL